jgi:taurine--2-oxoglutarate transaminase
MLETIVGTNGVLVPPPGYLQGVRDLCDKYGIVYIADEVMVGFGRIGEWFAFRRSTSSPTSSPSRRA